MRTKETEKTDLADWLETPMGRALIQTETNIILPWLRQAFGYHALLIGEARFADCLKDCPINHRIWLDPEAEHKPYTQERQLSPLRGHPQALPLANDSVDLLFMPHTLFKENQPAEQLREAYRVLMPQGYLVISLFNLWSWMGILKIGLGLFKKGWWSASWIPVSTLKDWLALLGFSLRQSEAVFFGRKPGDDLSLPDNPIASTPFQSRLRQCMPIGAGATLLLAQKVIRPLTPVKDIAKRKARPDILLDTGLEPSANQEPVA